MVTVQPNVNCATKCKLYIPTKCKLSIPTKCKPYTLPTVLLNGKPLYCLSIE